jgi:dolichol-phosphate mannosyltransferase
MTAPGSRNDGAGESRLKVVAVVPTYNERENIGPLIEALNDAADGLGHPFEILVCDDNSPDGTQDVIREMQTRYDNVRLLAGTKEGLGVAYARGLRYALDELHGDIIMHMDADFSHNPADLSRMIAKIDEGFDLVVGSRYVPGGRLSQEWGIVRKLISRVANSGIRVIAGLGAIHDCTGGFRAYRATMLQHVDIEAAPRGYAVLTYLAYQSLMAGARATEIPITFSQRAEGDSKLRVSDAAELFLNAWWIRYDRRDRFYRRATGGLSGVAINVATLALLYYVAAVPAIAASAVAIEVSVLFSFGWRRMWSVALNKPRRAIVSAVVRTHIFAAPSAALTLGTFAVLTRAGVTPAAAQAIGVVPAMIWNYFVGDRALNVLRDLNVVKDPRPRGGGPNEEVRDVQPS